MKDLKCLKCSRGFDINWKVKDGLVICPKCGAEHVLERNYPGFDQIITPDLNYQTVGETRKLKGLDPFPIQNQPQGCNKQ